MEGVTKREVLDQAAAGTGCLGRSAEDEPVFVLCARDRAAALTIRMWAAILTDMGADLDKIADAQEVANAMDVWRVTRGGGGKVPD